jgi:adenine-specific DNA methylase
MRHFRDQRGGRPRDWNDPAQLRGALLEFIADFSNWDHAENQLFLETARSLTIAAHEALGGEPGTRPLVVDPFAGGAAIPLEALRVGADTFASDLNSVAVLLNKVVLEYVPRYGRDLVERFSEWGDAVLAEARKSLAALYPRDANGAVPIAYLWARTIRCEGPGCGVELPLIRATQLSKRAPITHVRVVADGREIRMELAAGPEKRSTATVSGGKATCPRCGYTTPANRVKAQMMSVAGGANTARLFAVLLEHNGSRHFRSPTRRDHTAVQAARDAFCELERTRPGVFPTESINPVRPYANSRGVSGVTRIGISRFIDLYTARQATSVVAFQDAIRNVRAQHRGDQPIDDALETLLVLALDRLVMQNTSLSRWHNKGNKIEGLFSKQALQVLWDFAESNPTHSVMASWSAAVQWVQKVLISNLVLGHPGRVERAAAEDCPLPSDSVDIVCTDPPYFAAIPYADLSDVFHVWLRRGLRGRDAGYFRDELAEKERELVVTNSARGPSGEEKDEEFFARGMQHALVSLARSSARNSASGLQA